ncbi:MAG: hypothetical protein ABI605_06340 [Rhizobacter sp.]
MNLPSLDLQALYAHFAWGMVLAACGVGLLAWRRPLPARLATAWLVLAFVACALPGSVSPSYWLGLAFQLPSGLMVACCAMTVWMNARGVDGYRVLPLGLATGLALSGLLLYADSAGWLYLGLYARGFGPEAALAGLLAGAAALFAIAAGKQRGAGFAVLLSLTLFALLRLPTGNVWDALLDPWLWLWAVFSLLARASSCWRARTASPAAPASSSVS